MVTCHTVGTVVWTICLATASAKDAVQNSMYTTRRPGTHIIPRTGRREANTILALIRFSLNTRIRRLHSTCTAKNLRSSSNRRDISSPTSLHSPRRFRAISLLTLSKSPRRRPLLKQRNPKKILRHSPFTFPSMSRRSCPLMHSSTKRPSKIS